MRRFVTVHFILVGFVVSDLLTPVLRADATPAVPQKKNYLQRTWDRRPGTFKRKTHVALPPAQAQLSVPVLQTMKPKQHHAVTKLWNKRHRVYAGVRSAAETTGKVAVVVGAVALGAALVYLYVQAGGGLDLGALFDGADDSSDNPQE